MIILSDSFLFSNYLSISLLGKSKFWDNYIQGVSEVVYPFERCIISLYLNKMTWNLKERCYRTYLYSLRIHIAFWIFNAIEIFNKSKHVFFFCLDTVISKLQNMNVNWFNVFNIEVRDTFSKIILTSPSFSVWNIKAIGTEINEWEPNKIGKLLLRHPVHNFVWHIFTSRILMTHYLVPHSLFIKPKFYSSNCSMHFYIRTSVLLLYIAC